MWIERGKIAIGGLENVGFARGEDFLLTLSNNGEAIFDCLNGKRIARLHNGYAWSKRFTENDNVILGSGMLENKIIPITGLHGKSELSKRTNDGWSVIETKPANQLGQKPEEDQVWLISPDTNQKTLIATLDICEMRAFGFSSTGLSCIVATSCDLVIWGRNSISNR